MFACDKNANIIITYENTNLWIGNYKAALDYDFLKNNNISVIVNCTKEIPFIYDIVDKPIKLETVRIPIFDTTSDIDNKIMNDKLDYVIPFINTKFFKEHKNILVHCAAGKSRSASIVAAFMFNFIKHIDKNNLQNILKTKDSYNFATDDQIMVNVIKYIISKRSCTFFYGSKVNFIKALRSYSKTQFSFPLTNNYASLLFN